jgi:hypothetical protein
MDHALQRAEIDRTRPVRDALKGIAFMISAKANIGAAAHPNRRGCSEDRLDEAGSSTLETYSTWGT